MQIVSRLTALVLAGLPCIASAIAGEFVKIPWNGDYPHNNERTWSKDYELGWSRSFMNGTPQEKGIVKREGVLNAEIYQPKSDGPQPYIVLMHGCAGMDSNTKKWASEYADFFQRQGLGVLVLDSFTTRGVKESCGKPDGHWGRRRSEDAYSALDYLVARKDADRARVFLLGRSNGGLATVMALEDVMAKHHANKFAMGFALVPACRGKITANFYAPLFIFSAGQDDANPAEKCVELAKHERQAGHSTVKTIIYRAALHGYMDRVPPHRFHGWRMGFNEPTAKDTLRTIASFLQLEQPPIKSGVEFR
ncbi:MAG: prolyl oligopeptidase family serine peptidase [Pseudomonadota bacterium]